MNPRHYIIQTKRIGLRAWLEEDVEPFSRINADPEVMKFFPGPLSKVETERFVSAIENHFNEKGFGLYAVDELASCDFIGFIGLNTATFESDFTPCVEVGWRLSPEYWGKGFATEGALACLKKGFQEFSLEEIVSFTSAINNRSVAVMKRIGLKYRMDFDHPRLDPKSQLCKHALYSLTRMEYETQRAEKA
jgi:[ribosomal protein S5]-alanine N-acetyltransferase